MSLESRAQSLKPINTHLGILETQLFAHNSTNLAVSGAVIFVYYFYFLFFFGSSFPVFFEDRIDY